MNRKKFLYGSFLGLGAAIAIPTLLLSKSRRKETGQQEKEPNQLNEKLIKDFVVAGHSKLELTKEMLNEHPNLIYTSYDWGNGDFEEAIEGAGHLGNKEIVNYLISQGARANLFIYTMLGQTDIVKPILEAHPEQLFTKGPHGFTLLHHALIGEATDLADYLKDKGLNKRMLKLR